MAAKHENQVDYAFVAVLVKRGKVFSAEAVFGEERSVYVGRKDLKGAGKGDLVVIRDSGRGRGRVTRRLGRADSLETVLEGILTYYRIPRGFPAQALSEAEERARLADRQDQGRRDLTSLFTVTIDPDEAKDFDDAISLERNPDTDEVTLYVHIADVSYFVEAGSALDRVAGEKTTSVYVPLLVEPMLPPILANDVCSLRPDQDRKCVTVQMVFKSGEPAPSKFSFYRSTIRSRACLTYNQVDDYLEDGVPLGDKIESLLDACNRLAQTLHQGRYERGALDIETFEPEFRLSEDGDVLGARPMPGSDSHALIEEFMIAANEVVARYLENKGLPAIYRVHEEPDPASVDALFDLVQDLGIATPPFSLEEATPRRAGAAVRELLRSRTASAGAARDGSFFSETVLRSLKQARYLEDNLGHYGLASTAYLHFTSPIRRYPDMVVHRSLLAGLGLQEHAANRIDLSLTAERSSMNERRAAKVEHLGDDVVLADLLERQLFQQGWDRRFEGEIISLIPSGLFVRFAGIYEGFVPARTLRGDYFAINEKGSALVGRRTGRPFRLGDAITVRVVRIDKQRGKVELERTRR